MLHLTFDEFVEKIPAPCALISDDHELIAVNESLRKIAGAQNEGKCYSLLAGLVQPCPGCNIQEMLVDGSDGEVNCHHERFGRTYIVSFGNLRGPNGSRMLLETVRPLTDYEESCRKALITSQENLSNTLDKLSCLVSISRTLMKKSPIDAKLEEVVVLIEESLGSGPNLKVWIELGNRIYGSLPDKGDGIILVQKIGGDNTVNGRLCANFAVDKKILPEDEYFLQEAADLIVRQLELAELEAMLRHSEERYKKLAANLAKEMWSRTEALSQERSYLEGVLMSSADCIMTTDLEGRIVEFNPAAENLLGYSAEEVQGKHVGEIWVDPVERERILKEVTATGGISNYQTQLKHKSGRIVEISLTLSVLKDGEGRILGTVGVSKDVGEEKAIMRELERLNQNYVESVHFISHEMKNSLLVIGGFIKRLLGSETDPSRKNQLEIIYHHSKFLEAMSRDFLTMADLEQGEFQLRVETIGDFYEQVILPAMHGLRERYPDSFQSYDASMGGVGAIRVQADPRLMEVVYRNLFGNALKYGKPNGRIAYGVVFGENEYIFNVWNEGPGVEPHEAEKIFNKFYRVKNEATKDKRGTGLGLYNIRKIIEAHGGRIWCESRPGHWINFLFTLPR